MTRFEIMSQHFHIWRDKQTIQGSWQKRMIMQMLRNFHFYICFNFCNNFTVQYHEFEEKCVVIMSGDICRGDWCLALHGFWFKQLWNNTNNIMCSVTATKTDNIIFAQKYISIWKVHCMNSGLSDAPCNMKRQAKSRKRLCLGIQDKIFKMHITQKLLVGFLPNLHQQTRRILVHLFVYEVTVLWIPL